jgi:hypothetical protein
MMDYQSNASECKPERALPPPDRAAEVFASWVRVIEGAPLQNKPALLAMMARDAAVYADSVRQQFVDDVWWVAGELGLVTTFGVVAVQDAIASGFAGGTS